MWVQEGGDSGKSVYKLLFPEKHHRIAYDFFLCTTLAARMVPSEKWSGLLPWLQLHGTAALTLRVQLKIVNLKVIATGTDPSQPR
jgi:hypothetical protein